MSITPVTILLDGQGYEVGRLESWKGNPEVFDGWLEETPGATDELVINGHDMYWATYLVLAQYMEVLNHEIRLTGGRKGNADRLTVESAAERLAATAEAMQAALVAHFAHED